MATKRVAPASLSQLVKEFKPGLHTHYKHGDKYVALLLAYALEKHYDPTENMTTVMRAHHHESRKLLDVYVDHKLKDMVCLDLDYKPHVSTGLRCIPFVVYVSCLYGSVNARPLYDPDDDAWTDMMGEGGALVARFTPCSAVAP